MRLVGKLARLKAVYMNQVIKKLQASGHLTATATVHSNVEDFEPPKAELVTSGFPCQDARL